MHDSVNKLFENIDYNEATKQNNENIIMFKGQDDYDLPKISVNIDSNDGRFQMDNEYDKLTREVAIDLDEINLDEIDPQSEEFSDLPYLPNILFYI